MKIKSIYLFTFLVFCCFTYQCTTKKNTAITRGYHNLTARYNVFFNGNESFKQGVEKIDAGFKDNYSEILPIFKYDREQDVSAVAGDMDVAIKKAAKLITQHSITVKPKRNDDKDLTSKAEKFYNKPEYCDWVDDAYLLMGKSHFYKHDYEIGMKSMLLIVNRFKHEEIKYDAYLWLARTNIQLGKFRDAEDYLALVEKDKKHPKHLDKEMYLIYADFFCKQKKYQEAIKPIDKALKLSKRKKEIARLKFILAQIYQKQGSFRKASDLFTEIIKMNPPYEMVFNAQISRAISFDVGSRNGTEMKNQLQKMLKDEKNFDFQDQIYYALGNIAFKEKKVEDALNFYKLSARTSISNQNQKAISYLSIADIYFAKPDYQLAGAYYDSTMTNLDKSFSSYKEVALKTKSLSQLIGNLKIVQYEDSLQKVAKMPEAQRNSLVEAMIQKMVDDELKAKAQEQNYDPYNPDNPMNNPEINAGKWYFYNPTLITFGHTEFLKKFGERKLEDNWRRKNKAVVADYQDEEGTKKDSKNKKDDKTKKEYYLKNLPLNDSSLTASNLKIQEAMFKIGETYATKMKDYEEAIKSYEALNERFPTHPLLLESYYQLYLLCLKVERQARADYYKQEILTKFPNSRYAKLFTNPNYVNELKEIQKKAEVLYAETYNAYKQKSYEQVYANYELAMKDYPQNELSPKFIYIRAISSGEKGNQEEMKNMLKTIVNDYSGSDVVESAKDIIAVVESGKYSTNLYTLNISSPHYYVIVIKTSKIDINQIKFILTSFNAEFSNQKDFTVIDEVLEQDYQIITVKVLADKEQAQIYYNALQAKNVFKDYNIQDYSQFVISSENHTSFLKNKEIERYMKFYNANYK